MLVTQSCPEATVRNLRQSIKYLRPHRTFYLCPLRDALSTKKGSELGIMQLSRPTTARPVEGRKNSFTKRNKTEIHPDSRTTATGHVSETGTSQTQGTYTTVHECPRNNPQTNTTAFGPATPRLELTKRSPNFPTYWLECAPTCRDSS